MTDSHFPETIYSNIFKKYPELFFAFSTRDWLDFGNNMDEAKDENELLHQKGIKIRFKKFFEYLNIPSDNIVTQKQTHSANLNYAEFPGHFDDSDGIYTDKKNIFLTIKAADCIPIFLYEPDRGIIAAVHSGWKGTHKKILTKMISELKNKFNINPGNLIAFIGPGISQENYEVSEEIASDFSDKDVMSYQGRFYLDLKMNNYFQMVNAGLNQENIEISPYCTFENNDKFFSYRKEKSKAGRMLGIIGIADCLNPDSTD
jgi:YfiH family protein